MLKIFRMCGKEPETHIHIPKDCEILMIKEFHTSFMPFFNNKPDVFFHPFQVNRKCMPGKKSVKDHSFYSSLPDLLKSFLYFFLSIEFIERPVIIGTKCSERTCITPKKALAFLIGKSCFQFRELRNIGYIISLTCESAKGYGLA